jgi:hypothetical protein
MTPAQRQIWKALQAVPRFSFNEALERAKTTNKKALSSVLGIAVGHGLLVHEAKRYARVLG